MQALQDEVENHTYNNEDNTKGKQTIENFHGVSVSADNPLLPVDNMIFLKC